MNNHFQCVTFGEILFDILGNEKQVGGAPFNVAYHLQQLGIPSAMITRIGNDENGDQLKEFMKNKNITTDFVQTDEIHETSTVIATQHATGEMSYEIKQPVAWDFIELTNSLQALMNQAEWFIFGSLSSRNEITEKTLLQLLEFPVKKVFDINMRPPFVDRSRIEKLIQSSDIVKMNDDEFSEISQWNGVHQLEKAVKYLTDKYNLEKIIVTKGKDGSFLYDNNQFYKNKGYSVKVSDTIGCGDSFLAGIISSLIKGQSLQDAVTFAAKLGALVATHPGGTPSYSVSEVLAIGT